MVTARELQHVGTSRWQRATGGKTARELSASNSTARATRLVEAEGCARMSGEEVPPKAGPRGLAELNARSVFDRLHQRYAYTGKSGAEGACMAPLREGNKHIDLPLGKPAHRMAGLRQKGRVTSLHNHLMGHRHVRVRQRWGPYSSTSENAKVFTSSGNFYLPPAHSRGLPSHARSFLPYKYILSSYLYIETYCKISRLKPVRFTIMSEAQAESCYPCANSGPILSQARQTGCL